MLTSRSSPSVVTSVDTGPPQELNPSKSDDHLQKKRGRFFSRLFQVKKSIKSTNSASDSGNVAASTSGLRKHAVSSSRSDKFLFFGHFGWPWCHCTCPSPQRNRWRYCTSHVYSSATTNRVSFPLFVVQSTR